MSASRLYLECYETDGPVEASHSPDYLRGLADGEARASAALAGQLARGVTQTSATLADMTFGFAEARDHLLGHLRSILTQVAEVALPQIAQQTFASHLIDVLSKDFDTASKYPAAISVAPALVSELSAAVSSEGPAQFSFIPDQTLVAGQALIRQGEKTVMIDLPALNEALQTAMLGFEHTERFQSNG